MRKTFLIFLLIAFSSCSIVKNNNQHTKNFKEEFRLQAYCSCVLSGFENKNITSKMIEIDKSFYNPIIFNFFSEDLKRIGSNEAKIMKIDSLHSIEKVTEGKAGKSVLSHCLRFYNSKKLDSIVKRKYKEWKNIKNLDSVVEKNIPAY